MSWESQLDPLIEEVQQFATSAYETVVDREETLQRLGPWDESLSDAVANARAQKALVAQLQLELSESPQRNRLFVDKISLSWLHKLVTAARLRELSSVKIVKRGSKGSGAGFDISDLTATHYGRKILDGLGIGRRRRVLDPKEFELVKQACAKVKLVLPESVDPTTTERFFVE